MYIVILVDDEIWALRGLESIVDWRQYGYEVCSACRDAESALEAIKTHRPDLLFTDIRMPRISGTELMEHEIVRSIAPLTVIVSAYRDFDAAKSAIKNGAFDYLIKPLEKDAVVEVLKRATAQLSLRKENEDIFGRVDLGQEQYDNLPEIRQAIQRLPSGRDCYVCVSEAPLKDKAPYEASGTVTSFRLSPYAESFFYAGKLPDPLPGSDTIGISMQHDNFDSYREMIKEAVCSLTGGFRYCPYPKVAELQLYIAENYSRKLHTKEIADAFYLSEAYVYELFSKNTGTTISGFLKNVRMNRSLHLLKCTNLSVNEVALNVGYDDVSYFAKVFKKHFGLSPENYRQQY